MVSVCTVPARGGRSCEHFGGYKTINRIPLFGVDLHLYALIPLLLQNSLITELDHNYWPYAPEIFDYRN